MMEYTGPKINKRNFKKKFCINFLPQNGFIKVKYLETIDGDTAYFDVQGFKESVRFNVVDTPQIFPICYPLAQEAMDFTRNILENGNEIYLESDINNNLRDDTLNQRLLAWVWVDGKLLNYELIRNGYGIAKYIISPKMKYIKTLQKAEKQSQNKK